jgi:hypothetical protein
MTRENMVNKEFSATGLAKELNMPLQAVIQILLDMGLIKRNGNIWDLTSSGSAKGGGYRESSQTGRYIIWPQSILTELIEINAPSEHPTTATSIGKSFELPANRVNSILSELGWIKKDPINGWLITELGKKAGGTQSKYKTGVPYVRWPSSLISNKILLANIYESKGEISPSIQEQQEDALSGNKEFREKFPAKYRAKDGHLVRSKAEIIIDNWIYEAKLAHAYEKKIQIEEDIYCDFWIPTGNKVYIEYWGMEDKEYLARKKKKLLIYQKHNLNLIQLTDKDVSNIDDVLPIKLREFNIIAED